MDNIDDQFADADKTEAVIGNDQQVKATVAKASLLKGKTADQYQESAVIDDVLTEGTEDITLPQSTATPRASKDAVHTHEDLKAVSKVKPAQLHIGSAYTSLASETSEQTANKSKLGSETQTIEKLADSIDSNAKKATSNATEKDNVAAQISEPIAQDPGIKRTTAQAKPVASTSTKKPQSDLTVEVKINGKTTRCLVDTRAAVSVLDAHHMLELYDGQALPLKPSKSKLLKTVSGESLPVRGIPCTSIDIVGGTFLCEGTRCHIKVSWEETSYRLLVPTSALTNTLSS